MKNFLRKYESVIYLATLVIACIPIIISVYFFGNDYWDTGWHWSVAFLGISIMYITYSIAEDKYPNLTEKQLINYLDQLGIRWQKQHFAKDEIWVIGKPIHKRRFRLTKRPKKSLFINVTSYSQILEYITDIKNYENRD